MKKSNFVLLALIPLLLIILGYKSSPSPGMWSQLETQDVSSVATVDFAALPTAYRDFKVIGSAVVPVTDGANLLCRISIAASFKSGASDYEWQMAEADNAAWSNTENLADASISLMAGVGSAAGESVSFDLLLPHPAGTALYKNIRTRSWGGDTKPDPTLTESIGYYDQATSAVDGIQFLFSTGNIESGTFTLYGRMN